MVDFKDENSRAVLFKNNKRYIKISSFMSLMSLMMMSLAEEWGRGGAAAYIFVACLMKVTKKPKKPKLFLPKLFLLL